MPRIEPAAPAQAFHYEFTPTSDITAFELAVVISKTLNAQGGKALPKGFMESGIRKMGTATGTNMMRHFSMVNPLEGR